MTTKAEFHATTAATIDDCVRDLAEMLVAAKHRGVPPETLVHDLVVPWVLANLGRAAGCVGAVACALTAKIDLEDSEGGGA